MIRGFMLLLHPTLASDDRLNAELLSHSMVGANTYMAERWIREDFKTPLDVVVATNMLLYKTLAEQVKSSLSNMPALPDDLASRWVGRSNRPKREP